MKQYPIDRPIKGRLPFLKDRYILFVNNSAGAEAEAVVRQHYPYLRGVFESEGFRFIYMPEFLASLPLELMDYFFPGDNVLALDDIQASIQRHLNLDVVAGFIRCDRGRLYLAEFGGTLFDEAFYDSIFEYAEHIQRSVEYGEEKQNNQHGNEPRHFSPKEIQSNKLFEGDEIKFSRLDEGSTTSKKNIDPSAEESARLDLRAILKKYGSKGIGITELIDILQQEWKPLPLRISCSHRIIVSGKNEIEVKMTQLPKAVFFLFLRHPEGIRFKEIADYQEELLSIYTSLSRQDDMEGNFKRIEAVIRPDNNRLNELVSLAKRAFGDVLPPYIARFYFIDGPAGEAKKISLDRSLVTWEK